MGVVPAPEPRSGRSAGCGTSAISETRDRARAADLDQPERSVGPGMAEPEPSASIEPSRAARASRRAPGWGDRAPVPRSSCGDAAQPSDRSSAVLDRAAAASSERQRQPRSRLPAEMPTQSPARALSAPVRLLLPCPGQARREFERRAQRASWLFWHWCGLRGRGAVRAEKPCQSPARVAVRVAVESTASLRNPVVTASSARDRNAVRDSRIHRRIHRQRPPSAGQA